MTTITTAASAATRADIDPNAVNSFVQTLQANPFGALCLLLICTLIYLGYKERAKYSGKEKKKKDR